ECPSRSRRYGNPCSSVVPRPWGGRAELVSRRTVRDIVDDLHVPWPLSCPATRQGHFVVRFVSGCRRKGRKVEEEEPCEPLLSQSRPSSFALWDGGGSREEERRGSESWQLLGLSMPTEPVAEHGFCGRTGLVGWEDNRRRAPGAFSGRTAWRVTHGANHGGGENVPATMPHASWWWLGGGTGDFWIIRSRRSLRRCSTARRTELINICMKAASKQWRDWVLVMSGGPLLAPVVLEKEGEGSRGRAGCNGFFSQTEARRAQIRSDSRAIKA
ncbi:hypothetical protein Bbelb_429290, partial [Branchiostoma belcheri]